MGVRQDYGLRFGVLPSGARNAISDVAGVRVGHVDVRGKDVCTGVTVLIPHGGSMFNSKCMAAAHVINGFGKSAGLLQVAELGTLETPIILTNTLSVGTAATALVEYMLESNADIGDTTGTVNPVVMECNDGFLSDIRGMHVQKEHVRAALENASADFVEGAVGAGSGMCCYGLKGGIGTASRVMNIYEKKYTLGVLLLTNFGSLGDLRVCGDKIGARIAEAIRTENEQGERGSVIAIVATDVPLSARQLTRVCKRVQSGLARTGTLSGNGSGEIALAFSTANRVAHYGNDALLDFKAVHDDDIDIVFRAVIEATEEAVISSMLHAKTTHGRKGRVQKSLAEHIKH